MSTPRHEFYETDEKIILSVFDRGADPDNVKITYQPRAVTYTHGEKSLSLQPLKGQIDPDQSSHFVGKVKVEISLVKRVQGRWGGLIGDAPDPLSYSLAPATAPPPPRQHKNWEGISDNILNADKERSTEEDPNVGGDSTLNSFFQKIYADADEDTRRAMIKSFSESGGTTLSTNWDEVRKKEVEVKPPSGSEYKKWVGIMSRLTIIVAATVSNGIGKNGILPWHIPQDLKYFAKATSNAPEGTQNAVVMGRNTWESIPAKYRPLKERLNVVISHDPHYKLVASGAAATLVDNLQSALDIDDMQPAAKPIHRGFIIGGASIINETLGLTSASSSLVDRVLLTRILSPNFECDTFIPDFLASGEWSRSSYADLRAWLGFDVPEGVQTENDIEYEFQMWTRG